MSKILTTQLSGLLQRIAQSEESSIEETARLLAQAGVGQGNVYFACFGELQAIEVNALLATERFLKLLPWTKDVPLTSADRVCIFTRSCKDEQALALAKYLSDAFIPFSAVSSEANDQENELANLSFTYISLKVRGGIMPNDIGERIVVPHTLAALFVYEAVKVAYDEMLAIDDDEELE